VAFVDFWPGFDPYAYFVPLLRAGPFNFDVWVVDDKRADIEFHSVFQSRAKFIASRVRGRLRHLVASRSAVRQSMNFHSSPGPVRIWFTGENIRPPLGPWSATLSFDPDSKLSSNAYFPLWWQLFPELLGRDVDAHPGIVEISRLMPLNMYLAGRLGEAGQRSKFACAIISNPEPTRMRAIEALRSLGEVDVFGHRFGKPVKDKYEVFSQYQFAVCFENSLYPGYVTEKLFDAWGAGCIPLWWGLDRDGVLNSDAYINLASCLGLEDFVARVEDLQRDANARDAISSLPLLSERPSLDPVRALLAEVLIASRD